MTGPKMEKGEKQHGSSPDKDKSPAETLVNIQSRIENLLSSHEEILADHGFAQPLQKELEGIKETTGPNPRMNPEAALVHAQGMLETILGYFNRREGTVQSDIERKLRQILVEIEQTTGPSQKYYKK